MLLGLKDFYKLEPISIHSVFGWFCFLPGVHNLIISVLLLLEDSFEDNGTEVGVLDDCEDDTEHPTILTDTV